MNSLELEDINVTERLSDLIKRRHNIKYRGSLHTSKWNMFEASQKRHLVSSLLRNLRQV
jgi:hypothetical protein